MRVALAILDRRSWGVAVAVGAITAVGRGLLVVIALSLVSEDRLHAVAWAAVLAALFALQSFLRGGLRVAVQRSIHRRAAVAMFESDPLERVVVDGDPELMIGDGVHFGGRLLADRLPSLAGDSVAAIGVAIFLLATQPARLLLLGGAGLAFAVVAAAGARRVTTRAQDAALAVYRPLLDRMSFAMRGRVELVANGLEGTFLRSLDGLLEAFQRVTTRSDRLAALAGRVPLVAGTIGIALAFVAQGGTLAISTSALADVAVLAGVLPAFVGLAQNAHESWRLTLDFRPMAAILALPPTDRGGVDPLPPTLGPIVLDAVSFRYRGAERDALKDVSVTFGPGEPLVLSGPNGSGKSTLLRLLARLGSPTRGAVTSAGKDISEIDVAAWRSAVAYLPQQPHMPESMTVGEAISLFVPTAKADEIRAALARVGVLDVLATRAPDDPPSVRVGELSVGQRKRVALARVVLMDARIVLLDEPDANLDADGVAMVAQILHELAATRLVAIAAHTDRIVSSAGVHVRLAA